MENVILVIHLLLALGLIGVVLLQRSEGGGLGIGGGGGGVMTARGAATALGKVTWILAGAFLITSVSLTILSAKRAADSSVVDRVVETPVAPTDALPTGIDLGTTAPAATDTTTAPAATDTAPATTDTTTAPAADATTTAPAADTTTTATATTDTTTPVDPNAPIAPPRAD